MSRSNLKSNSVFFTAILSTSIALATPVASFAGHQQDSVTQDSTPSDMASAEKLAQLISPVTALKSGAQAGFLSEFDKAAQSNPFFAEMEAATPGFTAFISQRLQETLAYQMELAHPALIKAQSAVFVSGMTDDERTAAIAFFSSPTGQKIVSAQFDPAAIDPMLMTCLRSGKANCMNGDVMMSSSQTAAMGTLAALNNDEFVEAANFFSSDAGEAIIALSPRLADATAEWTNAMMAQVQSAAVGAVKTAVADWTDMQEEKTKP